MGTALTVEFVKVEVVRQPVMVEDVEVGPVMVGDVRLPVTPGTVVEMMRCVRVVPVPLVTLGDHLKETLSHLLILCSVPVLLRLMHLK